MVTVCGIDRYVGIILRTSRGEGRPEPGLLINPHLDSFSSSTFQSGMKEFVFTIL